MSSNAGADLGGFLRFPETGQMYSGNQTVICNGTNVQIEILYNRAVNHSNRTATFCISLSS